MDAFLRLGTYYNFYLPIRWALIQGGYLFKVGHLVE